MVPEETVAISEAEGNLLSKSTNKIKRIVHRKFAFVNLIKAIMKLAVVFEKEHNEKLRGTRIEEIAKERMGFELLTGFKV